jgi:hypothetical protein
VPFSDETERRAVLRLMASFYAAGVEEPGNEHASLLSHLQLSASRAASLFLLCFSFPLIL